MNKRQKQGTILLAAAIVVVWVTAGAATWVGQDSPWLVPIVVTAFTAWAGCVIAAVVNFSFGVET